MKNLIFAITLFYSLYSIAQLKPIGTWTDHLPYNSGSDIAADDENVYLASASGLFVYSTDDNSIQKYSKVNILNDVEVRLVGYSKTTNSIVIVYNNANIDIIRNNKVTNLPFIKNSNELKTINEVNIIGNLAYLSTEYGITIIDLEKQEIVDSYKFGPNGSNININSTTVIGNTIYAASTNGYYTANTSNNLLDFNNWTLSTEFRTDNILLVRNIESKLFIVTQRDNENAANSYLRDADTTTADASLSNIEFKSFEKLNDNTYILNTSTNSIILNSDLQITNTLNHNNNRTVGAALVNNRFFVADDYNPLIEIDKVTFDVINFIRPNGPSGKNIFDMDASNGVLWTANGGHTFAYNGAFSNAELFRYDGTTWQSYVTYNPPSLTGKFDILGVTANPEVADDVYFGTWGLGVLRYHNSLPFITYDHTNTELAVRDALSEFNWIGTGEGAFDEDGNFWTTNTYSTRGIGVRKKDGTWKSFDLSPEISAEETAVYDLAIDNNGYKWITLPKANSIVVFDDNGTIDNPNDDRKVLLTPSVGAGSIPGGRGIKVEVDKDGLIWIGTSDGIAVHYNPGGVFDGDLDFERIIFFDGENNEIVLQNSTVKEITVDGFNRKWISVENSGVLLLSDDGKETLLEFNTENSPLLSNIVNAITIDETTGEVFMGTDLGLVSYRGEAISGQENLNEISVFPNPVRPEYKGNIAINGLLDNSTVKITDINGTLVTELKSQGGQVLWDGNNFEGRRASTGVYLVFVSGENSNADLQTEVGKIMIVN